MIHHVEDEIIEAFNQCIARKSFEKITVQEICEIASISKTTFYRHFQDKYDVMNANFSRLIDELIEEEDCKSYRDLIYLLLTSAKTRWEPLKRTFEATGYNSLKYFIFEYVYLFSETITKLNRDGKGFTEEERLCCEVFDHGISEIAEQWITGNYQVDALTAADQLVLMLPESLRDMWFPQ